MKTIILLMFSLFISSKIFSQKYYFEKLKNDTIFYKCKCYPSNEIYTSFVVYKKATFYNKKCIKLFFHNYPFEDGNYKILYLKNDSVFLGYKLTDLTKDSLLFVKFRNGKIDTINYARKHYTILDTVHFHYIGSFQKRNNKKDILVLNNREQYIIKHHFNRFLNERIIEVHFNSFGPYGFYTSALISFVISEKKGVIFYKYYYEKEGIWSCNLTSTNLLKRLIYYLKYPFIINLLKQHVEE